MSNNLLNVPFSALRDALLPKLMRGEVRCCDTESMVLKNIEEE
jgi:hypothetical protein